MGRAWLSLAVELTQTGLTDCGVDLDLERVKRLNRGGSDVVDVPSDSLPLL
jgi:UDP-N-acetyl-D-mannosaminuronate dehydrogenase